MRLSPIPQSCDRRQAGIRRLLAVEESALVSVSFNSSGQATQIALAAGHSFSDVPVDPEEARFTQTLSRPGATPRVQQSISFYRIGLNAAVQQSLLALALSCNVVVLAQAVSGEWYVFGLNTYPHIGYSWEPSGMRVANKTTDSGQPQTGSKGITTELQATTNHYAPEFIGDVTALPTDTSAPVFEPDTLGPFILYYEPPDGAVGVDISPVLRLHFNEPVQPGSGTIRLRRWIDDISVASWQPAGSDVVIDFSGQVVTLAHSLTLEYETRYYFDVPAGVFEDAAGNSYAGNQKGDGDFITFDELTNAPPILVSSVPAHLQSSVAITPTQTVVTLVFNKDVQVGSGGFAIQPVGLGSGPAVFLFATSPAVSVSGDTITLTFPFEMSTDSTYQITSNAGSVVDLFGNSWAGLASGELQFTTSDETPPVLIGNNLQGLAQNGFVINPVGHVAELLWNEDVQLDTLHPDGIAIQELGNPSSRVQIPWADLTVVGDVISWTTNLLPQQQYELIIFAGAVEDVSGNDAIGYQIQFATGSLTTIEVDPTFELALGIVHHNNSEFLPNTAGKSIRLYRANDDVLIKTWAHPFSEVVDVGSSDNLPNLPTNNRTFRLTNVRVDAGVQYYLLWDDAIWEDQVTGQINPAINDPAANLFTVPPALDFTHTLTQFYPAHLAQDVSIFLDRLAVADETREIFRGTTGALQIRRWVDDAVVYEVEFNDQTIRFDPHSDTELQDLNIIPEAVGSNEWLEKTIGVAIVDIPSTTLVANTRYYVSYDANFTEVATGATVSTFAKGDWEFTTGLGDFNDDFNTDYN